MKRFASKLFVLLIAGAIVNVAVAWGCARFGPYYRDLDVDQTRSPSHQQWWQSNAPIDLLPAPEFLGLHVKFGARLEILHTSPDAPGWVHMSRIRSGAPLLSLEGSHWFVGADRAVYGSGMLPIESPNPIPFHPIWTGFAINTIFYAAVLWMLFAAPFAIRRHLRIKRGQCASCGYLLRAIARGCVLNAVCSPSMGLDTVEILMEVESRFGIQIDDDTASKCITVGDLQDVVVDLLVAKGRPRSSQLRDEVFRELVQISVDQMGIDPAEVRPDSRWTGDIT